MAVVITHRNAIVLAAAGLEKVDGCGIMYRFIDQCEGTYVLPSEFAERRIHFGISTHVWPVNMNRTKRMMEMITASAMRPRTGSGDRAGGGDGDVVGPVLGGVCCRTRDGFLSLEDAAMIKIDEYYRYKNSGEE